MKKLIAFALVLSLAVAFIACGCGGGSDTTVVETTTEDHTNDSKRPVATDKTVLMNGRSVMEGWMESWGYDWENPVTKQGFHLDFGQLDGDLSGIAASFEDNVAGLPEGSVVFFKFCFADFYGDNLAELEGIIDEVVDTAERNGLRLIIGNALPVRKADGSQELLYEYQAYNEYLEKLASEDEDVRVYDFYGVLSESNGFLKAEYDVGDSHLNEKAYAVLDRTFFPLLNEVFGSE